MKVIHFYIQVFLVVVDYQGTCGVVKKLFLWHQKSEGWWVVFRKQIRKHRTPFLKRGGR